MPNVTVPKDFFVKERRMYSNWQFAFWRELFQNSTDAGSTNIKIRLIDKGSNVIGVEFEDNGNGMTRDILENIYFCLGASTKNNGETVGGFGRARILTCFSMKNYTIHTQSSFVQGDGGSYEIQDVDYRRGCLIQLEIENEQLNLLRSSLEEYLSLSQLGCLVTIDDKRWTEWSHRRHLTRTLDSEGVSFANVYVNKSSPISRIVVRVNGTVMYSQPIRAKAQVIVEVDSRLSREVLTANRDGMHTEYLYILNSFIEELTVDTISALSSKLKRKNSTIRGRGLIFSLNPNKKQNYDASSQNPIERNVDHRTQPLFGAASGAVGYGQGTVNLDRRSQNSELRSSNVRVAEVTGASLVDFAGTNDLDLPIVEKPFSPRAKMGEKHVYDLPDLFIVDDTENPKIRSVIDRYNPDGWIVCERNGVSYNKGRDLYKLIMLWKVACQSAIDALMKSQSSVSQIVWGLGWVFSDEMEASCKNVEGGQALLLNPVNHEGTMAYGLSSRDDRKRLMALAKHEVAHFLESYHNERFAAILTDIDAKYDEKEVHRKMKETISE